jgi:alkanesulfonate monooxygenase
MSLSLPIEIFSTCPPSHTAAPETYLQRVASVARLTDDYGYEGILVYTDNSMVDPWLVSQVIVQNTTHLCPLVAVQPIYLHPYSVAKMVASFGSLYGRRLYLNMVAGGFANDLAALNDTTPHDKRYARLTEYTAIIKQLLAGCQPVTFHGEFYKVDNLSMKPALRPELFPGIFISGSSEAGLQAARALGAIAVAYPKPPKECATSSVDGMDCGIRVGIIARQNKEDAWSVAEGRFPEDRMGNLTHQLAMKVSDSLWHKQLAETA